MINSTPDQEFLVNGKYGITDLVDINHLRDLFEKFTEATGFTIGFLDHPKMNILISSGWRDICTIFHRGCPAGEEICLKSNLHLLNQLDTPGKLVIEACEHGLVDCGIPIIIEGKHIASLATGQLLLNKPANKKWFKNHAKSLGFNKKEYMQALQEIPVVNETQLKTITAFLGNMAQVISEMGYTRMMVIEEAKLMEVEIAERKHAEKELTIFQSAVDNSTDAIGFATPEGKHFYQNKAFDDLFGEIGSDPLQNVYIDKKLGKEIFSTLNQPGKQWIGEIQLLGKDGSIIPVLLKGFSITDTTNKVVTLVGVHTDLREQKKAEEEKISLEKKLRQTQKMETIGQLAGGIAHDFNNMLTGIMGGADFLATKLDGNEELIKIVKIILNSSARASELTQKLLVVSRKADYNYEACHMHELLNEVLGLLNRSIEKNIVISIEQNADSDIIKGDITLLQNLIVNLALNARDSMPKGGKIKFVSRKKYCDDIYCENSSFDITPGNYFELEITDTGCGIPKNIQEHIYDPFFTTKERGKGTGLGLSTVYNVIVEHQGEISMYSEEGIGTTFKISFPLINAFPEIKGLNEENLNPATFSGHALIVDDEELVLTVGALILQSLGLSVECASNGASAIELFKKDSDSFDFIVLDLIMPGKSGEETLHELRSISKTIPVIISSGFSFDTCKDTLLKDSNCRFLQKPYTQNDLTFILKELLG